MHTFNTWTIVGFRTLQSRTTSTYDTLAFFRVLLGVLESLHWIIWFPDRHWLRRELYIYVELFFGLYIYNQTTTIVLVLLESTPEHPIGCISDW